MLCSPFHLFGSEVNLLILACIVTCVLFTHVLFIFCFVFNFILSIRAIQRNRKRGKRHYQNVLFNLNGVSNTKSGGKKVPIVLEVVL